MENEIEEEWEIVDYYPCLEDEVETKKSRLRRVIDAGVNVGKKLVITGFVISSVPIVVPPLVVISALGLAFAVPFGVVFVSYACSQKVMSKLLPVPGVLEFIQTVGAHEEDGGGVAGGIEEEEKEESEDVSGGIEMRIGLVDDDDGSRDESIREEQEGLCGDRLDNRSLNNVEVGGEEEVEQQSLKHGIDEKPSFNDVALETKNTKEGKNNVGNQEEDSKVSDKIAIESVERENLLQEKNDEELISETKKHQTSSSTSKEISRQGRKKNLKFNEKRKQPEGDGKRREKEKGDLSSEKTNVEGQEVASRNKNNEKMNVEGQEVASRNENKEETEPTMVESEVLDSKQNHELLPNDDIGETSESYLDNKGDVVEEKIEVMVNNANDDSGVTVNYTETRIIGNGNSVEKAATAAVASTGDKRQRLHSDEEGLYGEEKIWEKIDAIRAIVGYKVPKRSSYSEEIKALYLFTGIEPPSMSLDTDGLAEFCSKLGILMSVIGLK